MADKILLVEDNIQASNSVRDYFVKKSYEVTTAYDGISGLKLAMENKYDIIFLDAMMPGMDGFTFCKKIREKMDTPVIMLTGLSDEENIVFKGH